jgi:hypothetical protein
MGAKNKVIAGDYVGKPLVHTLGIVMINYGFFKNLNVDKNTVESYEVVNEESHKSAMSAVGRGLVGSLLVGPVGMLAGLSAKSVGTHVVAIQFKDGKKSLLEVDDKIYSSLTKALF